MAPGGGVSFQVFTLPWPHETKSPAQAVDICGFVIRRVGRGSGAQRPELRKRIPLAELAGRARGAEPEQSPRRGPQRHDVARAARAVVGVDFPMVRLVGVQGIGPGRIPAAHDDVPVQRRWHVVEAVIGMHREGGFFQIRVFGARDDRIGIVQPSPFQVVADRTRRPRCRCSRLAAARPDVEPVALRVQRTAAPAANDSADAGAARRPGKFRYRRRHGFEVRVGNFVPLARLDLFGPADLAFRRNPVRDRHPRTETMQEPGRTPKHGRLVAA